MITKDEEISTIPTGWLTPTGRLKKTLSTEEKTLVYISRFRASHGDKFDYSNVKYISADTKVMIRCPIHGAFYQIPRDHAKGVNCPGCGRENTAKAHRGTKDTFIRNAKSVHGDTYDYSQVDYVNNSTKVTLVCKTHGEFSVTPNHHLTKNIGCRYCKGVHIRRTTEEFISDAQKIHGNTYSYTDSVFTRVSDKVTIGCATHGNFSAIAKDHLKGSRCPKCAGRHYDVIYLWRLQNTDTYKYGISTQSNVDSRIKLVAAKHSAAPIILASIHTDSARDIENFIKKSYTTYKSKEIVSGEGYTEMLDLPFDIAEELVRKIHSMV